MRGRARLRTPAYRSLMGRMAKSLANHGCKCHTFLVFVPSGGPGPRVPCVSMAYTASGRHTCTTAPSFMADTHATLMPPIWLLLNRSRNVPGSHADSQVSASRFDTKPAISLHP